MLIVVIVLCLGCTNSTEIVHIPDANFKACLIGNVEINTNGDKEIQESEASTFSGKISCKGLDISDLKGIESFHNLRFLDCSKNNLTTIDISNNTKLISLICFGNQLTNLKLGNNTELTEIDCSINQLGTLDVSNNTNLIGLHCDRNKLTTLFLSNNIALESLVCYQNDLRALDVSKNSKLLSLFCFTNQLTKLDVSNNLDLAILRCFHNQLTVIDVSKNTSLIRLDCSDNQLTSLNTKNGNNRKFKEFDATNNKLTCINVDDVAYSTENWIHIDSTAKFSEECNSF